VNRVGEQTTTVAAGEGHVTSRVELAYRRPGMTHLRYLDGPLLGVEVWKDQNRVYRYVPSRKRLEVSPAERSQPLKLEQRLAMMRENYVATLDRAEDVAGRAAHVISVRPRHPGSGWKRLWIDQETYLMLGSEDYDAGNRRVRSTRFTRIDLRTEPETIFRPREAQLQNASWEPSGGEAPLTVAQVEQRVGFEVLLPEHAPPGYRLLGSYVVKCECGLGDSAVRSLYCDGLNTLSVFQCGHPCPDGRNCWVADAPQGMAVRLARGEDTFLFVGEIDRAALERMANSTPRRSGRGKG
jgi:outer membrane lipoprotein-sorting protein